jgi:hypothetical protein
MSDDTRVDLSSMTEEELLEYWDVESEKIINRAQEPLRRRLRGLKWRCDKIREKSKNPLEGLIEAQRMMWESFFDLRDELNNLVGKDDA